MTCFHGEFLVGVFHDSSFLEREQFLQLCLVLQMEDSEGTVRQIGAFSEGIQNLTVSASSIKTHLPRVIFFKGFYPQL